MLTDAMENYLKVIYEILEKEERASTSAIATRMGLSSPSVTSMVKRLADLHLLSHEPYQGVKLTPVGLRAAVEIVRHHRLIELYLAEALGVPWDRVHDEAERLEHVISEDLEERIAAALGNPTVDPHGSPIPARDGSIVRTEAVALSTVPVGDRVAVVEVDDRNPGLLRYLGGLELYPGTEIEVVRVEPYEGPYVVKADEREIALGRAAANAIRVAPTSH